LTYTCTLSKANSRCKPASNLPAADGSGYLISAPEGQPTAAMLQACGERIDEQIASGTPDWANCYPSWTHLSTSCPHTGNLEYGYCYCGCGSNNCDDNNRDSKAEASHYTHHHQDIWQCTKTASG